ncbi:hypothetical protein PYCC9005_000085 [Savitreella phatthalungensis]
MSSGGDLRWQHPRGPPASSLHHMNRAVDSGASGLGNYTMTLGQARALNYNPCNDHRGTKRSRDGSEVPAAVSDRPHIERTRKRGTGRSDPRESEQVKAQRTLALLMGAARKVDWVAAEEGLDGVRKANEALLTPPTDEIHSGLRTTPVTAAASQAVDMEMDDILPTQSSSTSTVDWRTRGQCATEKRVGHEPQQVPLDGYIGRHGFSLA